MAAHVLTYNLPLIDANGDPVNGGSIEFYEPGGSSTPKVVYSDKTLSTSAGSSVDTNTLGMPENSGVAINVYGDGDYYVKFKDSDGVQVNDFEWLEESYFTTSATAGGTVDAITASFTPTVTALSDGLEVRLRAAGANTSTTPTFSPDGLTAKTITKYGDQALAVGDISGAGHELILRYNLSNDVWELLNPSLRHKTNVTAGGTVDAITATYPYPVTLTDGMALIIRAAGANTTSTPTFAPNSLTAKTIKKNGNRALVSGDIEGAGHELILKYNSTNDVWELLNPARPDCIYDETVTGAAVTSIDITGLDINTDKSYRFELDLDLAVGSSVNLYVNNDTTATNYYSQVDQGNGSTASASRTNAPVILSVNPGHHLCRGLIVNANGYLGIETKVSRDLHSGTPVVQDFAISKTTTITNVTQLTFTGATSGIGVDTRLRIYYG